MSTKKEVVQPEKKKKATKLSPKMSTMEKKKSVAKNLRDSHVAHKQRVSAWGLKVLGKTTSEIAAELGVSENTAVEQIEKEVAKLNSSPANNPRTQWHLLKERLEKIYAYQIAYASVGDSSAAAVCIKCVTSIAELLRLYGDSDTKQKHKEDDDSLDARIVEVTPIIEARRLQLENLKSPQ